MQIKKFSIGACKQQGKHYKEIKEDDNFVAVELWISYLSISISTTVTVITQDNLYLSLVLVCGFSIVY